MSLPSLKSIIGEDYVLPKHTSISVLDTGKSPAEWVEILGTKGITISERFLRDKANKLGARTKLGRIMLITPEHMTMILEDGNKCPSPRISALVNGGPKAGSSTKAKPSPATTSAARELLQSKLPGSGAGTKKSANDVSTSSGQKKSSKSR